MHTSYSILRRITVLSLVFLSSFPSIAQAEETSTCNAEKTRQDLAAMIDRDVHARLVFVGLMKDAEAKKGGRLTAKEGWALAGEMQEADQQNQLELDRIVTACGWPRKDVLGAEAVRAAAMIMVHAPLDYTRKHFAQIVASYKAGETDPLWMATIIDDELMAQGKPQRYGTRGEMSADGTQPVVEDPEHLEQRRRAFGIMPAQHDAQNLYTGGEPRSFDDSQAP